MTAKTAKQPAQKTKTAKAKTVAASTAKPAEKQPRASKQNLRAWNLRFGIVLLVLAIAVVVIGNNTSVPLTLQYQAKDTLASEAAGHSVWAAATRQLWDVHVSWLVAKFLAIFGLVFVLTATVWRKHYDQWLDRGVNKLRWVGSGLGTGAMAVTVAMLSGITDAGYLLLIFAALAILGSLATITELLGAGRRLRKYVIITALLTAALPLVAIGSTVVGAAVYDGNVPMYLYFIYATMFLVSGAIALACILRLRKRGKWADSLYAERMFMLLGFIAPTILALQVFAGVLQ